MASSTKPFRFLFAIILTVYVSYALYDFYNKQKLFKQLPELPTIEESKQALYEYLETRHENAQSDFSSETVGSLAMAFHANNYYDEAKKCYLLAIQLDAKAWEWNYYLGVLHRELGNSVQAIEDFKKVREVNPNSYMALYYMGEGYQQLDSVEKAALIFDKLSQIKSETFNYDNTKRTFYFPLNLYAQLELSKLLTYSSDFELAENKLKNLIEENISFGPAYRQLSNLYASLGQDSLSIYYSHRSNDLNSYTSPIDTLIDKLSLDSKSESFLLKQIDDAIRSSNSHWAMQLIQLGLENLPNSKNLISKAVKHYLDMNADDLTFALINNHIEYFKYDFIELITVGTAFAEKENKEKALRYFLEAEKIEGQKASSLANLAGLFFEKLGMKEKASDIISRLLREHPNDLEVISTSIFLNLNSGNTLRAKKQLTRLKSLSPKHNDIYVFEGIISQLNGDIEEAVKNYEIALKQNPKKKYIIGYLEEHYTEKQKWGKAIDLYEIAIKNRANDSEIQQAYGSLLLNCPDKSLRDLKKSNILLERAFINKSYSMSTKISAGRSLAISHFLLNNHGKAVFYMGKTIDIAKRAGASKPYIQDLEDILRNFRKEMISKK